MSYQMYRRTTLGNTLQESLDEMISHNLLEQKVASKVKTRLTLRGHLNTYRFCDNVWTLVMTDVEIKDASSMLSVPKIKIVACEGKSSKPNSNTSKSVTTTATERKPNSTANDETDDKGNYPSSDEME